MKCPVDGATLLMSERRGAEIDYCPECRGVWLDRGELDAIIERVESAAPTVRDHGGDAEHDRDVRGNGHAHDREEDRSGRRKGRFSVLTDLLGGAED
jgi:Zn-finger nucleic acid-binding protein